jgi:hypothetical protein
MTGVRAGNCGNFTVARAGVGAAYETAERGRTDDIRARRFPIVNVALIVANFAVWLFYELPNLDSAVAHSSFYPCAVDHACHAPQPWASAGSPRCSCTAAWIISSAISCSSRSPRSAVAGFRFPHVVVVAVRRYPRFGVTYRDIESDTETDR